MYKEDFRGIPGLELWNEYLVNLNTGIEIRYAYGDKAPEDDRVDWLIDSQFKYDISSLAFCDK